MTNAHTHSCSLSLSPSCTHIMPGVCGSVGDKRKRRAPALVTMTKLLQALTDLASQGPLPPGGDPASPHLCPRHCIDQSVRPLRPPDERFCDCSRCGCVPRHPRCRSQSQGTNHGGLFVSHSDLPSLIGFVFSAPYWWSACRALLPPRRRARLLEARGVCSGIVEDVRHAYGNVRLD